VRSEAAFLSIYVHVPLLRCFLAFLHSYPIVALLNSVLLLRVTKMTSATSADAAAIVAKLNKLTLSTMDIYKDAKSEALELRRKLTASLEDPVRRAIDLAFQV
jgi:hypothetical protein